MDEEETSAGRQGCGLAGAQSAAEMSLRLRDEACLSEKAKGEWAGGRGS